MGNNRGGFTQAVSVMAGVGAIAAFMSTAASCVISISTMLSRELLQNGLFKIYPQSNRGVVVKVFAICCSSVVIITATATSLYDPDINDPTSLAYSELGTWQSYLLSFCTVPVICGIFLPKASDWAVLAGFCAGWVTFLVLELGEWGKTVGTVSLTPFAENPQHIGMKSGHWAFVANVLVSVPLCCIDIGKWFPTPKSLQINSTAYDPEGRPLRYTQIISAMEGTREIFKDPIGIACIVIVLLLMVASTPHFGKSYNGCTLNSYGAWFDGDGSAVDGCEGPVMCGGLPCWAVPVFIFFPINKLLICLGFTRWKTVDEVEAGFPWGPRKEEPKEATI